MWTRWCCACCRSGSADIQGVLRPSFPDTAPFASAASRCCLQIDKTFGFETAVEEAQKAILAAKVEASSAYRGIGIVKLMGRQSGFITVQVGSQLVVNWE